MAKKLLLDCDVCGETKQVTKNRYLALIQAGHKHTRCRDCERLCGAILPRRSRGMEVLTTVEVPPVEVVWPRQKKGNPNGALAKLRVIPSNAWRYGDCSDNG